MQSWLNYRDLTIRISRLMTFGQSSHNVGQYLFVVRADEIPRCSAQGATIPEALNNFQKRLNYS